MALALNSGTITSTTGISAATWTGATKTLSAPDSGNGSSSFLLFKMTQAGGASTPTASLYVEVSVDAVKWYRFAIQNAVTDADETVQGVQTIDGLFRYIRPVVLIGGGTLPTIALDMQFASSAPITVS